MLDAVLAVPMPVRLLIVFVLAAATGGLVNWAIYRLVEERSSKPPIGPLSRRPKDAPPRQLLDLVPILGWYTLRRESAIHGNGFWVRPLLIELGLGAALAWLYWFEVSGGLLPDVAWLDPKLPQFQLHAHLAFLLHAVLILLLTAATFIDFDFRVIPDEITIPGPVLGVLLCTLMPLAALPIAVDAGLLFPPRYSLEFLRVTSHAGGTPWPDWLNTWPVLALGMGIAALWGCGFMYWIVNCRRGWKRGVRRFVRFFFLTRSYFFKPLWPAVLTACLAIAAILVSAWLIGGDVWQSALSSVIGLATGGLMVWTIRVVGYVGLGQEAMGYGDVTLMAMVGAFLGYQPTLLGFFFAPFAALTIVLLEFLFRAMLKPKKKTPKKGNKNKKSTPAESAEELLLGAAIPFGPYLAFGCVMCVIFWARVWHGYGRRVFELGWWLPIILVSLLPVMLLMLLAIRAVRPRE